MENRKKLLAVDDQPGIQLLLKDVLSNEGYDVETASNGQEAVDKLQHETYDLLILDYKLPIMNAEKVIGKMEEMDLNIPVILVTGMGNTENELEKLNFVEKVMQKPFNIQEICEVVQAVLS